MVIQPLSTRLIKPNFYFHIAQLPALFLPDCNQTKEIKISQFSHNFLLTLGPEQENSTIPHFLYFFMLNQPAPSLCKKLIRSTSPINCYGSIYHFHKWRRFVITRSFYLTLVNNITMLWFQYSFGLLELK